MLALECGWNRRPMIEGVAAECRTWSALASRCLGKTNLLWRAGLEFLGWADPGWLAGERGSLCLSGRNETDAPRSCISALGRAALSCCFRCPGNVTGRIPEEDTVALGSHALGPAVRPEGLL